MRSRPEEKKLEALSGVDGTADRATQSVAIKPFLADKHFRVVAKAATLAGERSLPGLIPELIGAYARFLDDPVKRDPNCIAKGAIARALVSLNCEDVDFFINGSRYKQLEPVWGGSADTAIDVRCSCAMGLATTGYSRAVPELTALLNDKESRARAGAARAISCANPALALGESRNPKAIEYLRGAWDAVGAIGDFPVVLIRAAALNRTEAAFDWLISLIESGARAHADAAVEALAVYERNTKLNERVKQALAARQRR